MPDKKNILFISYDGMTDPLGQSQVIPYLVGLTSYGYRFTILSCEKNAKFNSNKKYVEEILRPYPIKWVAISYHKNPPVFSSLYDVMRLRQEARRLHREEKFDMVHTRAGVPALIGLWMKKKMGVKFLHDIREFYADSRIDGGMWNTRNFVFKKIYHFFKRKEEEEIRYCDAIVCLTYAAEKIIRGLDEYKKNIPLEVIPCSVDLTLFDPGKISDEVKNKLRNDFKIHKNDFIVSYLGSLGGWYLTDEMLQCCKEIANTIPAARFLFITPHEEAEVFEAAAKFGIDLNKIMVTHAKRHEVPMYLSLSNYSIFFIKPCYSKKSSSPTKHAEIMAMGIPVITNKGVGDVADIVARYNSGIVLESLDVQDLKTAAIKISEEISSKKAAINSAEIRKGATEYYDLDKAVKKYKKIYDKVLLT
ncbi:MAG: glycosyltransferase [Ginsengibacter sp.]